MKGKHTYNFPNTVFMGTYPCCTD